MDLGTALGVFAVGAAVGLLGGLFGKGGSAVATPILAAIGIPPIIAVASPLPATIPGTLVASIPYYRSGHVDRTVLRWSLVFGIPATVAGAIATRWISGGILVETTEVIVAGIGLRFLLRPSDPTNEPPAPSHYRLRLALVAGTVGAIGGLLANSGGFLLAPLYVVVLRLPIKSAFAASLLVASILAIPGTIVHAALGHIDWAIVGVFGTGSVPLSYLGARIALRTQPAKLERVYGGVLAALGIGLLAMKL